MQTDRNRNIIVAVRCTHTCAPNRKKKLNITLDTQGLRYKLQTISKKIKQPRQSEEWGMGKKRNTQST